MLKTQNYGFNKPELSDSPPDITVMNPNWDTIDKKIKENTDAIAQNSEAISTVKTEITKMDMSWDKISGKPNSFVPSAHSHTKADIGLGSVQNYGVATQAQVDEGKANNLYVTPLSLAGLKQSVVNGKQAIVNAINDSLGYNSGLTINNKNEEYSWWIKNRVVPLREKERQLYEALVNVDDAFKKTYTVLPYTSINRNLWSRQLEPGLYLQIRTLWRGSTGYNVGLQGPVPSGIYIDSDHYRNTIDELPVAYKELTGRKNHNYRIILVRKTTILTGQDTSSKMNGNEMVWYKINI